VRSPNWLGDAVMALPAMSALSTALSPEKFCVLARRGLGNLFKRYRFINETIEFSRGEEASVHENLRNENFDAIFLFTNSFRSAWNAGKVGCKIRVGHSGNWRRCLLTHPVDKPKGAHMADYYFSLVDTLSADGSPKEVGFPLLPEEKEFAGAIDRLENAVGLPLGARYGSAKCWPHEKIKDFINIVLEKTDKRVVLFGTDAENVQAAELAGENKRVINLAGKTSVGGMAAVMERCGWIVANDSGPLHVAAELGKNCVALFGPTDASRTAPRVGNLRILTNNADCAPCFKRECPTDHRCMKNIDAAQVFNIIERDDI